MPLDHAGDSIAQLGLGLDAVQPCRLTSEATIARLPAPLEAVERDPEVDEFTRILVRAELPGRAVRVNMSIEKRLLAAIDASAQRMGKSRSAFVADAT